LKDYLLHLRPAEWPILALHFLTGAALAVGVSGLALPEHRANLILGTLAFVLGINGGTLALNSAFDRDRGPIAYLEHPPPAPRGLAVVGAGLLGLALLVALRLPSRFLLACAACAVLSVLYSMPPVRLKGVAGLDWLVNFLGFGFLTPYAGWSLTGRAVTATGALLLASFTVLYGALYPLTQLYHLEDDTARGDRTFAAALGITRTFQLSIPMAILALAGFGLAASLTDWAPPTASRWAALGLAALVWALTLWPWWKRRSMLDSRGHQGFMKRCFLAWAVTDMAVLWAFAR
jgi:4-hydroxybenzoate polyprenyltransferase